MTTLTRYFADDGKEFATQLQCENYELAQRLERAGLSNFTKQELTIGRGLTTVDHLPFEAPWMNGMGACTVKIFEVKRDDGVVKFGVGNEIPPILAWVVADDFYEEWPD
jgi:hypothetical protein